MVGGARRQARARRSCGCSACRRSTARAGTASRSTRATASSGTCSTKTTCSNEVVPLVKHLTRHDDDRRDRLQLRRLPRDGAGAAPSVHVHVVRHDGRRVRHVAVPRRLLRRGLLLPEPAVVPARPRRRVLPRSVPPQQVGAGHRRARHLPRRQRTVLGAAAAPRASTHSLHVWNDSKHDWPDWRPMARRICRDRPYREPVNRSRAVVRPDAMKKIGVLFGMENTFPPRSSSASTRWTCPTSPPSSCRSAPCGWPKPCGYDVIVDRISHDIPFYRAWLKNAALGGTKIINNPFWWSADDKFFNYALATRLGVAIPPTVLLPHKEHPTGTTERSMRNLQYPLDWDAIFEYVGFPAFLKPFDGGGWRDVYKVNTPRGVLQRLRPDAHAVHDAAARRELQGVLPLLRRRAGEGAHHALRSARAVPRALRAESAGVRSGAARARRARRADAVPRARLRPQHGRVRGARTACRTRSTS